MVEDVPLSAGLGIHHWGEGAEMSVKASWAPCKVGNEEPSHEAANANPSRSLRWGTRNHRMKQPTPILPGLVSLGKLVNSGLHNRVR